MSEKVERDVSKSLSLTDKVESNKKSFLTEEKEGKSDVTCSEKKKKKETTKHGMSIKERSWEDMVITPMPGIPPLNCSPPYKPRKSEPLPYAESPEGEEELMFQLEMDY